MNWVVSWAAAGVAMKAAAAATVAATTRARAPAVDVAPRARRLPMPARNSRAWRRSAVDFGLMLVSIIAGYIGMTAFLRSRLDGSSGAVLA